MFTYKFHFSQVTEHINDPRTNIRSCESMMFHLLCFQHIGILLGGRMLGRLIFSQGLANACLVSSTDCGETGTCRLYDKRIATVNMTIIMATGKVKFNKIHIVVCRITDSLYDLTTGTQRNTRWTGVIGGNTSSESLISFVRESCVM